jgi:urease accessory protein UreE
MQFLENDVSDKSISEVVTGEGDSIAVPLPRPHPLLEDARMFLPKRKL